jgi:hypothetical protein
MPDSHARWCSLRDGLPRRSHDHHIMLWYPSDLAAPFITLISITPGAVIQSGLDTVRKSGVKRRLALPGWLLNSLSGENRDVSSDARCRAMPLAHSDDRGGPLPGAFKTLHHACPATMIRRRVIRGVSPTTSSRTVSRRLAGPIAPTMA